MQIQREFMQVTGELVDLYVLRGSSKNPPISANYHISVLRASGFCSPERGCTKLLIKYVCHGFVQTQSHKAKFQEIAILVGQT